MRRDVSTVWVVGAGLLGTELARVWRMGGGRVLTIDKRVEARVRGNAAEYDTLAEAAAILPAPEVIYVCVSTRGGTATDYRRAYRDTTEALLHAQPKARVIFCSTTGLYPDTGGGEVTEETPCEAEDEKSFILLDTERLVTSTGGIVARLAALYGFGRCELVRRHVRGEPRLSGGEERVLNYVYVGDAARALFLLADPELPGGSIRNVCGESATKREMYAMLEKVSKIPAALEISPGSVRRGLKNHRVSAKKMRDTGWFPRMSMEHFTEVYLFEDEYASPL